MQASPQIRVEIRNLMRCCEILFNATPFIPLNADEHEVMIAYMDRMNRKFALLKEPTLTAS